MAVLGFVASVPLQAQAPIPEPARQRYVAVLAGVRDSLKTVLAASWDFGRDLKQAGPETVLARAAALRARCSAASRTVQRAPAALDGAYKGLAGTALRTKRDLKLAMQRVGVSLRQDCESGFADRGPGVRADSVRAWGPYRSQRIETAISNYETSARAFTDAIGARPDP